MRYRIQRGPLVLAVGVVALSPTSCSDSEPSPGAPLDERESGSYVSSDAAAASDRESTDQTLAKDRSEAAKDDAREIGPPSSATDWRVVVAPATTVYRAPNLVDDNVTGWWDKNQL